MKQIKVNPSNKPYYSEDFIKGFECGTKAQFDADKEVIDQIKQAREEIARGWYTRTANRYEEGKKDRSLECMRILDNLIVAIVGRR